MLPDFVQDYQAVQATVPELDTPTLKAYYLELSKEWNELESQRKGTPLSNARKVADLNLQKQRINFARSFISQELHRRNETTPKYVSPRRPATPPRPTAPPVKRTRYWLDYSTYAPRLCESGESMGPCNRAMPAMCKCVTPGPNVSTTRPPPKEQQKLPEPEPEVPNLTISTSPAIPIPEPEPQYITPEQPMDVLYQQQAYPAYGMPMPTMNIEYAEAAAGAMPVAVSLPPSVPVATTPAAVPPAAAVKATVKSPDEDKKKKALAAGVIAAVLLLI